MYQKVSVPKPGQNKGRGLNGKDRITFVDTDDIISFPSRDDKGVKLIGDVILKANAYAISLYVTPGTVALTSNSEGDIDNEGFIPTIAGNHPGNEQEVREYKANWLGRNCIIFYDYCDKPNVDVLGSICNPMRMQVNYTGNNEANSNAFTFTQASKGDDIGIYEGTLPYETPLSVIPAGSTTIALLGTGQYQLTGDSSSVVITDATGAAEGMTFTLLGVTSGTPPTIESNTNFILKDGATWTANAGSQITFGVYKSGDTDYVFIEKSRF